MTTIERKQFSQSQGVKDVLLYVIRHHMTLQDQVRKVIPVNSEAVIKEFVRIATTKPLYLHYESANWMEAGNVKFRVDRICFYDNAEEYNKAVFRSNLVLPEN